MLIPILTLLLYASILLDIPILRSIIVFFYLSFIPGFVLLRFFRLKKISFLDIILFSVGLSIAFLMFMGLLVNELYFLGLSQPLSIIPLTVAISAFTFVFFFIDYRHDSPKISISSESRRELKSFLPVSLLLVLLPLLSIVGVLFVNIPVLLLSYVIMVILVVMSVVSKQRVPANFFPFLIFSISIALLCNVLLTSQHIIGWDSNLEYYVFRLTQINGHWGPLDAILNPLQTLTYNSMMSITLLPAVYSVLTHAQSEIVFKILYLFILSLVPLILYRIYEEQTGKIIGMLATIFFVFNAFCFYGEPTGLNRQIVGEFFFLLSIFLLLNKTIPTTKRRLLLIIFGSALAVSHYSLAYIYLLIIAVIFIISRIRPKFNETLSGSTVLLLFGITFSWYTFASGAPIISLANNMKTIFGDLMKGQFSGQYGSAALYIFIPQGYSFATWINLTLSGMAYLFIIFGVFAVILRPKRIGTSSQYNLMVIVAALILAVSFVAGPIAATLDFARVFNITMLFLSPCFVVGSEIILETIKSAWTKVKRALQVQRNVKNTNRNRVFLLIAILIGAYFLSQSGFINRTTGGEVHSYSIDFDRIRASSGSQAKINLNDTLKINLYNTYIPDQDVFSAVWLSNYKNGQSPVYAGYLSGAHVLISYGLVPKNLILPITNTTFPITIPEQDSLVYLGTLNCVNGIITTYTGVFSSSEISFLLDQNNLVYSNGNSEIWYVNPVS